MKRRSIPEKSDHGENDADPDPFGQEVAASPSIPTRRAFLGQVGVITAGTVAANITLVEPLLGSRRAAVMAKEIGPDDPVTRENKAAAVRHHAEQFNLELPIVEHPCNGDEDRYPNRIGSFTKNLAHNSRNGEVVPSAYDALLTALNDGTFRAIESVAINGHFGCLDATLQRRLVNPLSGSAFDLMGIDSHKTRFPAAPAFDSGEEAAEMTELYWMAVLRDLHFGRYADSQVARQAAEDLSRYSLRDFKGPRDSSGNVTPQLLFRDNLPGATVGPYVSQFLLQPTGFGAQSVDTRVRASRPEVNYGISFQSWLDIQNGCQPGPTALEGLRFIRNGRDLGQYVHVDALHQAYFVAALNLLGNGYPWNKGNPYGQTPEGGSGMPLPSGVDGARAQVGFGTFGGPHILVLVTELATRALQGVWFHKWFVHRRLRPEEFGGRVHVHLTGIENYPISSQLFRSPALDIVKRSTGHFLLPLAFSEGSPIHPAYGAGHATVAGACVTILKALFDGTAEVRNPVVASADGRGLEPFVGPPLTVEGELNKIASNVSTGRNIAGVHWRSDGFNSLMLGEQIAISVLRDNMRRFTEPFQGFTFTRFNGQTITI